MNIQLLEGKFTSKDLEKIITELIYVKIKFHEDQIKTSDEEETIKMRENRIIKLQNNLKELRDFLISSSTSINVNAEIILSK